MGGSLRALTPRRQEQPSGHPLLITTVCISVALDVGTNILNYFDAPSAAVPLAKGILTLIVLANLRRITSYLAISMFIFLFLARWIAILLEGQEPFLFDDSLLFFRILFFVAWLLLFDELRSDEPYFRTVRSIFIGITALSFLAGIVGALFDLDFFKAYGGGRGGLK
jgi:hypothetical protein